MTTPLRMPGRPDWLTPERPHESDMQIQIWPVPIAQIPQAVLDALVETREAIHAGTLNRVLGSREHVPQQAIIDAWEAGWFIGVNDSLCWGEAQVELQKYVDNVTLEKPRIVRKDELFKLAEALDMEIAPKGTIRALFLRIGALNKLLDSVEKVVKPYNAAINLTAQLPTPDARLGTEAKR